MLLYAVDDANLDAILTAMNVLISVIFLGDFTYRLLSADSKSDYVFRQFGWADLLASLPFAQAKILRVFRIVAGLPTLARRTAPSESSEVWSRTEPAARSVSLLLMGILVLELGSLEMLNLEQDAPGANITTGSDAIWYVIVTISTVGYGDRFPVTNGGRLFGAVIIIIGVGIFGTFTGYLANLFLAPRKPLPEHTASAADDLRTKVSQLSALVAQQQSALDEIDRLLPADET